MGIASTRLPRACLASATALAVTMLTAVPAAQAAPLEHCRTNIATGVTTCAANADDLPPLTGSPTPTKFEGAPAAKDEVSRPLEFLMAIMYDDADFGGASWQITSTVPCDTYSDRDWSLGVMAPGWNDRISSFRGYNQCGLKLFAGANFSGDSTTKSRSLSYVGSQMNDRTSSIRFY